MTRTFVSSRIAVLLATSVLVMSCASATPTPSALPTVDSTPRGGTLRVDMWQLDSSTHELDPQLSQSAAAAVFRCCLARTLLSHPGKPTAEGGAELRPDLAAAMPKVSGDGFTWTFQIRAGLHYAPPLQDVEITAPDFVRALQRTARLNAGFFLYSVIKGFDDYAAGRSSTIGGLEAPDAHTLIVHLTRETGDLGDRLALSPASPVPPLRGKPTAEFGVATGHDDGDGRFLVSSGPYMIEGSENLRPSLPAQQQRPAAGVSDTSLMLVRNPSWNPSQDTLRPAYSGRIEVKVMPLEGFYAMAAADVDSGRADLAINTIRPPQFPPEEAAKYGDGSPLGKVVKYPADRLWQVGLNLAMPPFDDVHVRRAVSEVIDKQAQLRLFGGEDYGTITGHLALDSTEGNALSAFDPFHSSGNRGSVANALIEMAQSKYKVDQTGMCIDAICSHLRAIGTTYDGPSDPQRFVMMARSVASDLSKLGIHLDLEIQGDLSTFFATVNDPTKHIAVVASGWGYSKFYLNGSDFFVNGLSGQVAATMDPSLLGASSAQLRSWGYSVASVPSIDDRMNECLALTDAAQTRCWAALDTYTTDQVVPSVALIADNIQSVVPRRVVRFSYDQSFNMPALDQTAVAP